MFTVFSENWYIYVYEKSVLNNLINTKIYCVQIQCTSHQIDILKVYLVQNYLDFLSNLFTIDQRSLPKKITYFGIKISQTSSRRKFCPVQSGLSGNVNTS